MPFAAAGLVAWVFLLTAAPYLPIPAAGWLYLFGSRICHQIAARSLHIAGSQLPVCARCYGIYAGAALVAVVWPVVARFGRDRQTADLHVRMNAACVVAGAVLINLITIGAEWAGLWSASNSVRVSAGGTLGAAAALAIGIAVSKLDYTPWTSTPSPSRDRHATRI